LKPLNGSRHNARRRLLWLCGKTPSHLVRFSNMTDALKRKRLVCQYGMYGLDLYDNMHDPVGRRIFSVLENRAGIVYLGTSSLPPLPLFFWRVPSLISEISQKSETHCGYLEKGLPFTLILITSSFSSDSLIPLENNWKDDMDCCWRNFNLK
jgi:hypothetical protein